jgi:hypothetical protein
MTTQGQGVESARGVSGEPASGPATVPAPCGCRSRHGQGHHVPLQSEVRVQRLTNHPSAAGRSRTARPSAIGVSSSTACWTNSRWLLGTRAGSRYAPADPSLSCQRFGGAAAPGGPLSVPAGIVRPDSSHTLPVRVEWIASRACCLPRDHGRPQTRRRPQRPDQSAEQAERRAVTRHRYPWGQQSVAFVDTELFTSDDETRPP